MRLASVCGSAAGVALRLRSRCLSVCAPLSPLADHRPKPQQNYPTYNVFLPAALAFAHRAFAASEIFRLAAALIMRLAFLAGFTDNFVPSTFAHLALAAAEILALPAALILRLFFGAATATGFVGEPKIRPSSFSSDWICSFIAAARRNCCADRLMIELIPHN
jgi:hypothetical protein